MSSKLTSTQKALIAALPSSKPSREVAELVRCSHTAVLAYRAELKSAASRAPADEAQHPGDGAAPPADEVPADEVPGHDEQRGWLADQVRALRGDVARYRAAGDASALGSANRSLHTALSLLAKHTPPDPSVPPAGMTLVPTGELEAFTERSEGWLTNGLAGAIREVKEEWPRCTQCEFKVPPADMALRIAQMSEMQKDVFGIFIEGNEFT